MTFERCKLYRVLMERGRGEFGLSKPRPDQVFRRILKQKKTYKQLSEDLGVSIQGLWLLKKRYGVETSRSRFLQVIALHGYKTIEDFFTCPEVNDLSFLKIAQKFKLATNTVKTWYRRFQSAQKPKRKGRNS